MHRWRRLALGLAAILLLGGCAARAYTATSSTAPSTSNQVAAQAPPTRTAVPVPTNSVSIVNFAFGPAVITVPVGTTVTWTNTAIEQHTVTARDRSFDSDAINDEKSFSHTFSNAGSFEYFCVIHPQMVGIVVVGEQ